MAVLASCGSHNSKKIETYQDAEDAFVASLTNSDTTTVVALTNSFLDRVKNGEIESAIQDIYVLYQGVLYRPADEYLQQLRTRFQTFPILGYTLERFSFSTPGNNDCCYVYRFAEHVDGQPDKTMKLVFNPVYCEGCWYLTFKDGNQSSLDLPEDQQVLANSPAPGEIHLNRQ